MPRSLHHDVRPARRRAATRVWSLRDGGPEGGPAPRAWVHFRMGAWPGLGLLIFTLLAFSCAPATLQAAEEKASTQYSEEQVKAAILVGFAKTTEWPPGTFKEGPKTMIIGILGRDTLGDAATRPFTTSAPGVNPSGQTVQFKVIVNDEDTTGCHVLFIPRQERRRTREILERLKNAPVLTVGETDDFLDLDGMVNLVPKDGKMKFEINLNAAKAANLKIPAKVLGAALKVRGKYD